MRASDGTNARSTGAAVVRAAGRTSLAVLLLVLYPLGRCAVAAVGLMHWLGAGWGSAALLVAVCLRWTVLWQLAALLTLVRLWHWPILAALPCVAPRLVLVLPGLVSSWLATLRHPRPRWDTWMSADGSRAAAEPGAPAPRADVRSIP
jgi:hypothetical protein